MGSAGGTQSSVQPAAGSQTTSGSGGARVGSPLAAPPTGRDRRAPARRPPPAPARAPSARRPGRAGSQQPADARRLVDAADVRVPPLAAADRDASSHAIRHDDG